MTYKIIEGNLRGYTDVARFIGLINDPPRDLRSFFDDRRDIYVSRAPGRLDVMGGIADYSGSLVLEMPIAEATFAAVQKNEQAIIRITSFSLSTKKTFDFQINISEIEKASGKVSFENIRKELFSDARWASYIAGAFFLLRREKGFEFRTGANVLVASEIPIGKGVSSSAALEVAVMHSVCAAYDISINPLEMALFCQKVENLIVGAPCGAMDQITATCGIENSLISLLCQPAEILDTVKVPEDIEFWGIDSGVRHSVAGADYSSVRIGAFMGYRIIAECAGLAAVPVDDSVVAVTDDRWHGYLSNLTPAEYIKEFRGHLPEKITGAGFIDKFEGITDTVTRIDPTRTYAVRSPAEHAIYENDRVKRFTRLLQTPLDVDVLHELGNLMSRSHASYAACGLTERGTDSIVRLVKECRKDGVFGARITGGGSGGTVAIIAKRGSSAVIQRIAGRYEKEMRKKAYIFHGSSPGAAAFGYIRLTSTRKSAPLGAPTQVLHV